MKKSLFLLLFSVLMICGCKKTVDYFYYETIELDNRTEHDITVRTVESNENPFEAAVPSHGVFRETKDLGEGVNPHSFVEVSVTFDNEYTVIHKKSDATSLYHNICHEENYRQTEDPDLERNTVYTFTFTNDDYDYAVSQASVN